MLRVAARIGGNQVADLAVYLVQAPRGIEQAAAFLVKRKAVGKRPAGIQRAAQRDLLVRAAHDRIKIKSGKRLPPELPLELVEIPLHTRSKNADVARLIRQEGEAMLAKVQPGERIVTLEVQGRPWSTEQLAEQLARWRLEARNVNLMVGGPEGLAPEVCARSEQRWSLSPLTLPHPLVRILLGEQIYRAWTVLNGHPYHK